MREILRGVVLNGTAKGHAQSELYSTAGKTASSYIPDFTDMYLVHQAKKGNFAGFIGFAPAKVPRVEIYVGIHNPHTSDQGAHGSEHAAPVFKQIAEKVLQQMNVAPDQPHT
jgi:penicillin-binding protein 2B